MKKLDVLNVQKKNIFKIIELNVHLTFTWAKPGYPDLTLKKLDVLNVH